jgi:hypothetical protein
VVKNWLCQIAWSSRSWMQDYQDGLYGECC